MLKDLRKLKRKLKKTISDLDRVIKNFDNVVDDIKEVLKNAKAPTTYMETIVILHFLGKRGLESAKEILEGWLMGVLDFAKEIEEEVKRKGET